MTIKFQRIGSISNAHVGRDFEVQAMSALAEKGIIVKPNFSLDVGIGTEKKRHVFDLGSDQPAVIVECKSHRWTTGNNVPSAKMTVWNEAMYYFYCAPVEYRKILFVLRDTRSATGESLAEYYMRTYKHLIPDGVEIWEYDGEAKTASSLSISSNASCKTKPLKIPNALPSEIKKVTNNRIRDFVNRTIVEPARNNNQKNVKIISGNVHKAMGLNNYMPSICSALDAGKFENEYRVRLSVRKGPKFSSTVEWIFAILP